MIYELVLTGQQVIRVEYTHWTKRQFHLGPCYENSTKEEDENSTEEEAEHKFRTALVPSLLNRHTRCWDSFDIESHRRPGFPRVTLKLETALLFTCRQICQEAEHTLYATNTFAFREPDAFHAFMRGVGLSPGANNLAIRKIHLSVDIVLRHEEYAWNKALSLMVQKLPEVNNVCVTTNQRPWTLPGFQRTITNPAAGRNLSFEAYLSFVSCRFQSSIWLCRNVIIPRLGCRGRPQLRGRKLKESNGRISSNQSYSGGLRLNGNNR